MRQLISGALLVIIGSAASLAGFSDDRLRVARGFVDDGLLDLARGELLLLRHEFVGTPQAAEALYLLGVCARAKGDIGEAIDLFESYAQEAPESPVAADAMLFAGDGASEAGELERAIGLFGRLIDRYPLSPRVPDALIRRARARRARGDAPGAKADLRRIDLNYPNSIALPYARHDLAALALEEGNSQEALATFDRLFSATVPGALVPHSRREWARALLQQGRSSEALPLLEGQEDQASRRLRGEVLLALERPQEALLLLEEAASAAGPGSDAAYSAAWCRSLLSDHAGAAAAFQEVASAGGPLTADAWLAAAEAATRAGESASASSHYVQLVEGAFGPVYAARGLLGLALLEPGTNRALAFLDQAIGLSGVPAPELQVCHMARARIYLDQGENLKSSEDYGRAARLAEQLGDDASDAQYGQAVALLRGGDAGAAATLAPARDARNLLLRAEALLANGDLVGASGAYGHLSEFADATNEQHQEALFGLGWCALAGGQPGRALEAFDRLATLAPTSRRGQEALVRMSDAFVALGDDRGAEELAGLYLQHAPMGRFAVEAHLARSRALLQQGRLHESVLAARAARQSARGAGDAESKSLLLEAQARFDADNFSEAESLYIEAAARAEDEGLAEQALYRVGDSRFNRHDAVGAARAYALVLERFPSGTLAGQAVSGLLWAAAESAGQVDAEVEISRARLAAGEEGAAIALHAGLIFRDRDRPEDSRHELERVVNDYPDSPQASEALFVLGLDSDPESTHWSTLLKDYPSSPRAPLVRRTLAARALDAELPTEAIGLLAAAPGRPPLAPEGRLILGLARAKLGEHESARAEFEPLVSTLGPDSETRWRAQMALALLDAAAGSDSLSVFAGLEMVVRSAPPAVAVEAQYRIAEACFDDEDFGRALPEFLRIRYLYPEHARWVRMAELGAGACYEATGRKAEARAAYLQLIEERMDDVPGREAQERLKGLGS